MKSYSKVNEEKLSALTRLGFDKVETKTQYEKARWKGMTTITLYTSGKMTVAGKADNVEKTEKWLLAEGMISIPKLNIDYAFESNKEYIGCDESLKGDTFGGITLAAVRADKKMRVELKAIGVGDSKKFNDDKIMQLAGEIKKILGPNYRVKSIDVVEYNILTDGRSVTFLLNNFYNKLVRELHNGESKVFIDKYPGGNISGCTFIEKGESKVIEIAAASILAREAAIRQIESLTKKAGFKIPKGSTHVKDAIEKVKQSGMDLSHFAKMHFKNVQLVK